MIPTVVIPDWTAVGVIPPIDSSSPVGVSRSPYPVSLLDVVMRFCTSGERRLILLGFLNFRAALHALGYREGFQWLDGSFMEQVEVIEKRDPRDMDVVSFVESPKNEAIFYPSDEELGVVDHDAVKLRFRVDSYIVELDRVRPQELVQLSAYWYSLWSHRRNDLWKGFLQVELAPVEDEEAREYLQRWGIEGSSR